MTVPDEEVHHRIRGARQQIRVLADKLAKIETPASDNGTVAELRDLMRQLADVEAELTGRVEELPPQNSAELDIEDFEASADVSNLLVGGGGRGDD